ncbi:NAD-P-binding protein [Vararia minispora EC-137]|uniref:NAD-P-binding protein n=1 Tax=Vararia minispora EC-137 TaxID=1314806 RepID=A0ACB8QBF0_9AGAM|nr:NAD-P-binding protein [Vararia minispora EC-137]
MSSRPLFVVLGLGDGSGTGSAAARVFSQAGYRIALIARSGRDTAQKLADELNNTGGEAAAFPVSAYNYATVHDVFGNIDRHWPNAQLRAALFNAGHGVWKGFLDVTEEDIDAGVDVNIRAAYSFSREVILRQKELPLNDKGKRGTLLFTGATASLRGNVTTSGFAPGKSALRILSQSLAKEFDKQNIHVAHSIIDGQISTARQRNLHGEEWSSNPDNKLLPESIAQSYLYLVDQDRSAWTWELDLRPAHEKW